MKYVVTGGSRGIGAAICTRLMHDGHLVVDLSRSNGHDVTDGELEDWLDHHAPVGGIISCAGDAPTPTRFEDVPEECWRDSLDLNLLHHVRILRWFIRQDLPGAAVLIASTAGLRPSPLWTPYAAAKAALVNLGLSTASEQAGTGRRIYVVAPGRCATDLRRTLAPDEDPSTIMQPHEVADVVATLLDDDGGVLAGQVIEVARRSQ